MEGLLIEPEREKTGFFLNNPNLRNNTTASLMILEFCIKFLLFGLGTKAFDDASSTHIKRAAADDLCYYKEFFMLGLFSILFTCVKYPFNGKMFGVTDFFFACQLIMDAFAEVAFFLALPYFSHVSNGFIVARVVLVVWYMLTQYANLLISCRTVNTEYAKYLIAHVICCVLFALTTFGLLVLNLVILVKLKVS